MAQLYIGVPSTIRSAATSSASAASDQASAAAIAASRRSGGVKAAAIQASLTCGGGSAARSRRSTRSSGRRASQASTKRRDRRRVSERMMRALASRWRIVVMGLRFNLPGAYAEVSLRPATPAMIASADSSLVGVRASSSRMKPSTTVPSVPIAVQIG